MDTTVFSDEKTTYAALVNNGDFYVDRATNTVYLWSDVLISNVGKVTYYYDNPRTRDSGLFSINYRHGTVHTQRVTDSSWTLLVDYEYSDYRIEYHIARIVDPKNYEVDYSNRTVRITDTEIIKSLQIPRASLRISPFYVVNYDYVVEARENIQELKDYYSPIVRDYSLKALTKNRIL